jgi:RNA polymerase sigma-70 factor (ECF subfamily)
MLTGIWRDIEPCRARTAILVCAIVSGKPASRSDPKPAPGTLGAVLYADGSGSARLEQEWTNLVHSIGSGDQLALHALYERTHRPVFTLIMRITNNRQTAEELTLDVFHDVWRHASTYDPAGGTVLGWILNQARSRAIDQLRFERRQKRIQPETEDWRLWTPPRETEDALAFSQRSERLRKALSSLSPDEQQAIENAYFSGLTYGEVAARLNQPLGTVKTRIRSGLAKLRAALAREEQA